MGNEAMNKTGEDTSQPVWNQAELLERTDHDLELLQDLLAIFKDDFPRTMRYLETAISGGDLSATARLSHTLKGMLSSLGGTRSAAAAAKIEQTANAGDKSSLSRQFDDLKNESAKLLPELDAYMTEVRR
jgi:HPt (histidine-containing phosphotransfer) domain-containing protein